MKPFKTYYGAKFAREQKDKPRDWLVLPNQWGSFDLIHLKS